MLRKKKLFVAALMAVVLVLSLTPVSAAFDGAARPQSPVNVSDLAYRVLAATEANEAYRAGRMSLSEAPHIHITFDEFVALRNSRLPEAMAANAALEALMASSSSVGYGGYTKSNSDFDKTKNFDDEEIVMWIGNISSTMGWFFGRFEVGSLLTRDRVRTQASAPSGISKRAMVTSGSNSNTTSWIRTGNAITSYVNLSNNSAIFEAEAQQ
ncbi:MAG: hypothetical protein FWE91_02445 [Defluviitaleaceae bacterium]|nr:hypothetical protein [Defluviitaleaceae bacterium]MCL2835167.1 hypothetical protein [Defluviitaleaceae bacterium]